MVCRSIGGYPRPFQESWDTCITRTCLQHTMVVETVRPPPRKCMSYIWGVLRTTTGKHRMQCCNIPPTYCLRLWLQQIYKIILYKNDCHIKLETWGTASHSAVSPPLQNKQDNPSPVRWWASQSSCRFCVVYTCHQRCSWPSASRLVYWVKPTGAGTFLSSCTVRVDCQLGTLSSNWATWPRFINYKDNEMLLGTWVHQCVQLVSMTFMLK